MTNWSNRCPELLARYSSLSSFPSVGDKQFLYLDESTNVPYIWNGSTYIEVTNSAILNPVIDGEVDTYGDLPSAAAHNGETYYVKNYSIFSPTKLSGLYLSNGSTWDRRSDKVLYSLTSFTAAGNLLQTNDTGREVTESTIRITDSNGSLTFTNAASYIHAPYTNGQQKSLSIRGRGLAIAYDFITITTDVAPSCNLNDVVTINNAYIYRAGGTDIAVADGGTNISSYTTGDIIYASGTTALSKLAGVATGNALISGGVGTAPSWGKIGISTHVSGLGAGVATFLGTPSSANLAAAVTDPTGTGALVFANTPTLVTPNIGAATGTSLTLTSTSITAAGGSDFNCGTDRNFRISAADSTFSSAAGVVARSMTNGGAAFAPLYLVGSTVIIGTNTNTARATFVGSSGLSGVGTTAPESVWHVASSSTEGLRVGLAGSNQQVTMGVGSGRGEIQAILQGTGLNTLALNPGGGNVTTGADLLAAGNITITGAGKVYGVKEGSNCGSGTATLTAGSVTVSTTAVRTGDRIYITRTAAGGTQGFARADTIVNATSFQINSSSALDTSTFNWEIRRPN